MGGLPRRAAWGVVALSLLQLLQGASAAAEAAAEDWVDEEGVVVGGSSGGGDVGSFLAIGDWGCDCLLQRDIADRLGHVSDHVHPQFFVLAGDNFYNDGIQGDAHSSRFNKTFEDVYKRRSLMDPTKPWYAIAGNHDHRGNVSAQIAYTNVSWTHRWKYYDYWYQVTRPIPGNITRSVQFIFVDTVIWCGAWDNEWDEQPVGTAPEHIQMAEAQQAWLEKTLAKSTADLIFLVGHYPVYSVGPKGPTKRLIADFQPLMEKYGVAAYISGHDHDTQHLEVNGLSYFVVGNAGENSFSEKHKHSVPHHSLKMFQAGGGFMSMEFSATGYKARIYNFFGHETYHFSAANPRKKKMELGIESD